MSILNTDSRYPVRQDCEINRKHEVKIYHLYNYFYFKSFFFQFALFIN